MKNIALATTFAILATTGAHAGGYSDPVVEPMIIQEAAVADSKPSATLVLLLSTLVVFGAAAGQ